MGLEVELETLGRLKELVDDIKVGLDPEILVRWYRAIEAKAKVLCPPELRESIRIEQDPILSMKFKVISSRRAVPYLIEAIEDCLPSMPFSTRLYFQKLEEMLHEEMAKALRREGTQE